MKTAGTFQRFLHDKDGTAIAEAALAIPFAIILMAGLIDFGRAYFTLATAQKSTRNAVRYLTTLPPAAICDWGFDRAKNLARFGNVNKAGRSLLVNNWTAEQITLATPSCPATTASTIRIQADVPFTPMVWSVIGLPDTMTLKVDYEARWIGG